MKNDEPSTPVTPQRPRYVVYGRCPGCKRRVPTALMSGNKRICYKHRNQTITGKPICSGSWENAIEHD